MENVNKDLAKINPAVRPILLTGLNTTLAQYMQLLQKQNAALESLTRAIRHLETTINKMSRMDSAEIPLQLGESLNTFVEYHINPKFYQNTDYEMLTSSLRKKIAGRQ